MAWYDIIGAVENLALGSAKRKREAADKEAEAERIRQEKEKEKKKQKARGFIMGKGQMTDAEWKELNKASK